MTDSDKIQTLPLPFLERMKEMLGDDYDAFLESYEKSPHLRSPCKHRKALLPGLSGTFPFPNPADPVDQHRILL